MSNFSENLDLFLSNREYSARERGQYIRFFLGGGRIALCFGGGLVKRVTLEEWCARKLKAQ